MFFQTLAGAAWAFRIGRTAFRAAACAATARSGNHQPRDDRQDRPIGPFLPCLQGARTKEGAHQSELECGRRGEFDSDRGVTTGTRLARSFGNGGWLHQDGDFGPGLGARQGRTPPVCQSQGWSWRSCFAAATPANSRGVGGIPSPRARGMAAGVSRRPAAAPLRRA
jgi:hypothetical protein